MHGLGCLRGVLVLLWTPGPPNPRGESMSRIWVNLRTPARNNPTVVRFPESILWVVLAAAAVTAFVFVALWAALSFLGR